MNTIIAYSTYLLLAVPLTLWVARSLFKNGRIFLVDSFRGNEPLADSVNHLLVVGFYLVNLGFVAVWLREAEEIASARAVFETVSWKLGVVVLGGMHFFNVWVFSRFRRRSLLAEAGPPVMPDLRLPVRPRENALETL